MKIFEKKSTRVILGLIWGFALAMLFRKGCYDRKCIIVKAPKPSDVEDKIYGFDNKCYKYFPEYTKCTDDAIE